jgi:nucleoside-diphosphate-sugar epimerase
MKIIITGSLGNVAKPLAEQLIAEGHDITVISSSESKKVKLKIWEPKPLSVLLQTSTFWLKLLKEMMPRF